MTNKEAIMILESVQPSCEKYSYSESEIYEAIDMAIQALNRVIEQPTVAQPKIIYCKDCKFTDEKKPIADGRYWCVIHESFMYFCSDAERRQ